MNNSAKSTALLALIAALAFAGTATLQAQTIVNLNSAGDTAISGYIGYQNYNLQNYAAILMGSSTNGADFDRGLFSFDVSSIPSNATVTSATLEIAFTGNNNASVPVTLSFYRMNTAWTASGATWNSPTGYPAATPAWPSGGGAAGDASATPSFSLTSGFAGSTSSAVYFDFTGAGLTSDVQNWVNGSVANDGWLGRDNVENDTNGKQYFLSSWSSFAAQPILQVQYSVVPEPKEIALLALGTALLVVSIARAKRRAS